MTRGPRLLSSAQIDAFVRFRGPEKPVTTVQTIRKPYEKEASTKGRLLSNRLWSIHFNLLFNEVLLNHTSVLTLHHSLNVGPITKKIPALKC